MNKDAINMDTTAIEEIITSVNSKINIGGSFNKTSALNSFSCLTSAGIGSKLINSICSGLESMNSCINQITKDLKEISEAQEKVDDEIIKTSTPFTEDFNNENLFSPITSEVKSTVETGTDKVVSTYTDDDIAIKIPTVDEITNFTDIKTQNPEEITSIDDQLKNQTTEELVDITTQPIEEIKNVTSEELIDELNNHYIKQINTGTYQEIIEFDYDTSNIQHAIISNTSQSSSYSELLSHEITIFKDYLQEICSKLNIPSIFKLIENEDLLSILLKNYETNNVNIKLSNFSTDMLIKELNNTN